MDEILALVGPMLDTLKEHPWALMAAILGPEFTKRFVYPVLFRKRAHRLHAATLKLVTVIQPIIFATLILYGRGEGEWLIRGPVIGLMAIALYMVAVSIGESRDWGWAKDASSANRILKDFSLPDEVDEEEVDDSTVFGQTIRKSNQDMG
jgi:hypothetical protein